MQKEAQGKTHINLFYPEKKSTVSPQLLKHTVHTVHVQYIKTSLSTCVKLPWPSHQQ